MNARSRWSSRFGTLAHYYRERALLRYLAARGLAATGASTWLTIPQDGYRLRFYPSALSIALWTERGGRHDDEYFFRRYLRPGDTVIDVGANIGQLAIVASLSTGPSGRVAALEPHPRVFAYLRGNLALNGVRNVEAHHIAAGETEGSIAFSDRTSDDQNAVARDGADDGGAGVVEVPIARLDDLPLPGGPIALLKMDVEGYEEHVMRGGPGVLARTACVLFESWEVHCRRYGRSSSTAVDLLRAAGFTVLRADEAWRFTEVPAGYVSEGCEKPDRGEGRGRFRRMVGRTPHPPLSPVGGEGMPDSLAPPGSPTRGLCALGWGLAGRGPR